MKRRGIFTSELKENVVRAFDLPPDLAYGSVLLSVTGQNELLIENYRGILEYKEEHIRIYSYVALSGFLWALWAEYKTALGEEFGEYTIYMYRYGKIYYKKAKNLL